MKLVWKIVWVFGCLGIVGFMSGYGVAHFCAEHNIPVVLGIVVFLFAGCSVGYFAGFALRGDANA